MVAGPSGDRRRQRPGAGGRRLVRSAAVATALAACIGCNDSTPAGAICSVEAGPVAFTVSGDREQLEVTTAGPDGASLGSASLGSVSTAVGSFGAGRVVVTDAGGTVVALVVGPPEAATAELERGGDVVGEATLEPCDGDGAATVGTFEGVGAGTAIVIYDAEGSPLASGALQHPAPGSSGLVVLGATEG